MERYDPLQTIVRGLADRKILERAELQNRPARRADLGVLGIWAATAVIVFATLASFFLGAVPTLRPLLLLAAIGLGVSAVSYTVLYATRTKRQGGGLNDEFPVADVLLWSIVADPFLGLLSALAVLLFLFIYLAIWLPLLILAFNLVSLGELWRTYRGAVIAAEDNRRLGEVGRVILRRGGVLSRSWDLYLDATGRSIAAGARLLHGRIHRALLAIAASSLLLAALEVGSRAVPSSLWIYPILAAAVLTTVFFVLFIGALFRRRAIRPKGPPATSTPR